MRQKHVDMSVKRDMQQLKHPPEICNEDSKAQREKKGLELLISLQLFCSHSYGLQVRQRASVAYFHMHQVLL